ncbi:DUF6520 family protein [Pedobacter sp. UBA4863]|uniref:DUF6520 family protein n=1 Tax=Pedobacter sp. UBA4863 TaxID=1947060 RepID=UPI0025F71497|nr:DUF6520 family protein [Pedobacter sp. UBA4863]
MKKFKLSLAAFAFLFAVGTAIASNTQTETAFLWNPDTQDYDEPSSRTEVELLCDEGPAECGVIYDEEMNPDYINKLQ